MSKKTHPKIIIIVGPTSSGKTALSITLAKRFNGEIISADSRQVYRGLDLGTGKVTKKEMAGVPHHLLDVANPKKQFSASDFVHKAHEAIGDIQARGKLPIIAGGTGFYVDTLAGRMTLPEVPPNPQLRAELSELGADKLFVKLRKLDPVRAQTIEPKHKRRLIRAIEIACARGHVPKPTLSQTPYDILWLGIDLPDKTLKHRICMRLKERLRRGMVAEAERLHTQGLSYKRMEALGLEYRALAQLLKGKITKDVLITKLNKDIWDYAKRQRRWFRRNKRIHWFSSRETGKIRKTVKNFLSLRPYKIL